MHDNTIIPGRIVTQPKVYPIFGGVEESIAIHEKMKSILSVSYETIIHNFAINQIALDDCDHGLETIEILLDDFLYNSFPSGVAGDDPEMSAIINYQTVIYSDALYAFVNNNKGFIQHIKDAVADLSRHDLAHSILSGDGLIEVIVAEDLRSCTISFDYSIARNVYVFMDMYYVCKMREILEGLGIASRAVIDDILKEALSISGTYNQDAHSPAFVSRTAIPFFIFDIKLRIERQLTENESRYLETTIAEYQKWILECMIEQNAPLASHVEIVVRSIDNVLILVLE